MARTDTLNNFCTDIADSIREKTGETGLIPASEFDTKIRGIETGTGGSSTDEWQPEPDWWDIDSILENDKEDYAGKVIMLLPNINPTSVLVARLMADVYPTKIKTSDGFEYTNVKTNITHIWDISKDKECSLGYKTRYVIYYYDSSEAKISVNTYNIDIFANSLYIIVENMNLQPSNENYFGNALFFMFKMKNGSLAIQTLKLNNLCNCRKIIGLDITNMTSISNFSRNSLYAYDFFEDYGNKWNTSNVTSFREAFNATGLMCIPSLDFNSATDINYMFNGAGNLIDIGEISNIKISGINLNQANNLNHDTLMRFINALYDYASEGSTNTYTLTLGTRNLAKLTDEEKAIATNKGWTLN